MGLERRFRGPLGIKLALEWRFRTLLAVKLALERWFRERLGAWGDPKGVPGCRKERPITPESTLRGGKSMPSGLRRREKTNFVSQLPQDTVSECVLIDFWSFREVSEPSEVSHLSAKTGVRPFALSVALKPRKTTKIQRFQGPLDVKLTPEWRFQEPWDVKLAPERRCRGRLDVKLALGG